MGRFVIYKIYNDLNPKVYVGQTWSTADKRFTRHLADARQTPSMLRNMPIIRAIRKYGADHFRVEALETLDGNQTDADLKELEWALKLNTFSPHGYNLKAGSGHGALSDETKLKIGAGNRGKIRSPETRLKLSQAHLGNALSNETKRKLSLFWKGKPQRHPNRLEASIRASQKTFTVISPRGSPVTLTNMRRFCIENNLSPVSMCNVIKGRTLKHRGWSAMSVQPSVSRPND